MLVIEKDGKFYAIHPGTDLETVDPATAGCEISEAYVSSLESPYVVDYDGENDSLKYSDDFYPDLYKQLEAGKTQGAAYEALGLSASALGRFRAHNACRKALEKAGLAEAREGTGPGDGDTSPELEAYRGNPYVRLIVGSRMFYTEEFYKELSGLLEKGISPVDAYKSLGFDTAVLGTQRAYKAADRAREWRARQVQPAFHLGDFPGNIPLAEKMKEWEMPEGYSQWEAYLMGRVIYLETIQEELKKKTSRPPVRHTR